LFVGIHFIVGLTDTFHLLQKTLLIEHYEKTPGAINVGGHVMVINTNTALKLIDKYFKN